MPVWCAPCALLLALLALPAPAQPPAQAPAWPIARAPAQPPARHPAPDAADDAEALYAKPGNYCADLKKMIGECRNAVNFV